MFSNQTLSLVYHVLTVKAFENGHALSPPSLHKIILILVKLLFLDSLFVSRSHCVGFETWLWDSPAVDHDGPHRVALGVGRLSHEGQHGQRVLRHPHVGPLSVVVLCNHTPAGSSLLGSLQGFRELVTGAHAEVRARKHTHARAPVLEQQPEFGGTEGGTKIRGRSWWLLARVNWTSLWWLVVWPNTSHARGSHQDFSLLFF